MSEVFVEGFGISVSKKSERLVVKRKGEVIFERPFFEVERVIVSTTGATVSGPSMDAQRTGFWYRFVSTNKPELRFRVQLGDEAREVQFEWVVVG